MVMVVMKIMLPADMVREVKIPAREIREDPSWFKIQVAGIWLALCLQGIHVLNQNNQVSELEIVTFNFFSSYGVDILLYTLYTQMVMVDILCISIVWDSSRYGVQVEALYSMDVGILFYILS